MASDLDTSDVTRLAVDLTTSGAKVQIAAVRLLETAAGRVKAGMKADASGHRFLPRLPNYVSYDRLGIGLEYEIGFTKRGQGNLANIAAFGTSKNAPVMDHAAALRREEPAIVAALLGLGELALGPTMVKYVNRRGESRMVTEAQAASWSRLKRP